jgi:Gpi18-like mannosyltransferase
MDPHAAPTPVPVSDSFALSLRQRIRSANLPVIGGLALVSVAALVLRATLLNGQNTDVEAFDEWLQFIRDNGGIHAFKYEIGDYTPLFPYLLLIWDHVLVGASDTTLIKLTAIIADFVCAAFVYLIVRLRHPDGLLPLIAFAVILFAPTVAVNSAYWGQVDMIWTAALVGAVYFFLVDRSVMALVLVGIAFAMKQQAVFIGPFLLVLVLRRAFPWRYFLIVPAVYILSVVPAWLAGGSGRALLTVYLDQADKYSALTLNAPTAFQWVPEGGSQSFSRAGIVWGVSVLALLVVAAAAYVPKLTPQLTLALATASVLVAPFVLPKMHERYFFAADVLTIVLAFYVPRLVPLALLVQVVSIFSYAPFLFEEHVFSGALLALFELVAITVLLGWIAIESRRAYVARPTPSRAAG